MLLQSDSHSSSLIDPLMVYLCVLLVGVDGVLGVAGLSVSVTHTASSDTDVFDTVVILQHKYTI